MALDQYDEARAVLKQAADRRLEFSGARRLSYYLAFVRGDPATMARELDASVGVGETNGAFGWQARASAFSGQCRGGARSVRARHPAVDGGQVPGRRRAAHDGGCGDPRRGRPV